MKRYVGWIALALAALLAATGIVLALNPKALTYARSIPLRIEHKFWNQVDPPRSVADMRAQLFDSAGTVVIGAPDATEAETIVAFVDYNCLYCRRQFHAFDALLAQGQRFRVILRHMPHSLESIALAKAVQAARRQGGERALHQVMAAGETRLLPADLPGLAAAAGLDPDRLAGDAADPAIEAELDRDLDLAWKLRIRSTPTLVIGGEIRRGVHSADQLSTLLRG